MIPDIHRFPHIKTAYDQAIKSIRKSSACGGCGEAEIEAKYNDLVKYAIASDRVKATTQTLYPGIHVDRL